MYQVLARKYRPRNFNELVGQNHVSRALTSALERGRLHHAYLFTGTRGVGKTTIARILAKCLNCETGVTSTPCEVCATCKAVNEGRFIDLIEIDAASRTKVEDTRELLDNVPYAPTQGRYKVYLIDEVHMLSTHSFNALLKTLEEPPEHVKFLFATTDPQKLPITVISRCLQFTLRPLAVDEITTHLTQILNQESIHADHDAIWQIAESAQGSLRDALSLTDQAIAYGQGSIQHQDVKEMLGLIDRTIIYDLILAIHQNRPERVSQLLLQFRQQALDVSLVLDQLISILHELALMQYLPDLGLKYSAEIQQKIKQLAALIAPQDLQLYYQIACKGRSELQWSVTQEQGFEMCILRLLAFRPLSSHEILQATSHSHPKELEHFEETNVSQSHSNSNEQNLNTVSNAQQSVVANIDRNHDSNESEIIPVAAVSEPVDMDEHSLDFVADEKNAENISLNKVEEVIIADLGDVSKIQPLDSIDSEVSFDINHVEINSANIVEQASTETIELGAVPELSLFGDVTTAVDSKVESASTVSQLENIFFLETEKTNEINQVLSPQLEEPIFSNEKQPDSELSLAAHSTVLADVISIEDSVLMPQDILKLKEVSLEGQWDIWKWEFWFRNSELSPAVQELAQQGVMQGEINGESIFTIPGNYEKLLSSLISTLEEALTQKWPKTRLEVKYAEVTEATPYQLQTERKHQAFNRAETLLNAEALVKELKNAFGGEIQNIQLKS